jgi:hypothetical protein
MNVRVRLSPSSSALILFLSLLSPSYLLLIYMPIIFYKNQFTSLVDTIYSHYSSPSVQNGSGSVLVGSLSRREAASVKTSLLDKIHTLGNKKKLIIFSNHQLQYITSGLKSDDVFNMWSGNFSINEIADWISYLDSEKPHTLPTEYLVSSITSPNNDNGAYMVGYEGNLPAYIPRKSSKICEPPFLDGFTLKQSFESCFPIDSVRHYLDFKSILAPLKRLIDKRPAVETVYSPSLNMPFSIDRTGASLGAQNVGSRSLIFNEEGSDLGFDKLKLKRSDASDIVMAVLQIDAVAYRRGLRHFFVIPPVYESFSPRRSNSPQNLIMDEAIKLILKRSKATVIVDDRREPLFLGPSAERYYYHYDHPSPKYGQNLIKRILHS